MSSFNGYYGILFLLSILILGLLFGKPVMSYIEGFSNANGDPLLDSFPSTGEKNVNDNTYSKIWWKYPIFPVGSFDQITNNLRYRRNPDDGECRTADFCDVLYKDVENKSNYIHPLPPVPDTQGQRVNYYRTDDNLFMANQPGSLLELPAFIS